MFCRNCGSVIAGGSAICNNCGQSPATGTNYCPSCGHFCIPGDKRCIQCGCDLSATAYAQPQPSSQSGFVAESPSFAEPPRVETKVGPKFLPADKKYCRNCGLVIPASATRCEFCESSSGANYCHKCGSGTTHTDTVCSVCSSPLTMAQNVQRVQPSPYSNPGNNQSQPPVNVWAQNPQQNNGGVFSGITNDMGGDSKSGDHDFVTTLLLCAPAFFGFFGFHRLYTGHIVSGIVQFLTAGMCGIWWFIDVIMILTDSFTDKNGRKLRRK